MRIAQVTPTYWPEVMRGTERFVHDLGSQLAERGHEVSVLTTHRAPRSATAEDGMTVVRRWRPPELSPLRWYEHHVASAPALARELLGGGYDVAHVHFPSDAWAAAHARRIGGPPFALTLHGIPTREYLVSRRYRLEMLVRAVDAAAVCTVGSEAAAAPFRRYLLREPEVISPGVFVDAFAAAGRRAALPTLICAASLGDPRKRARLMFRAFERLRHERGDVRLLLFEGRDPVLSRQTASLPDGAQLLPATSDPGRLAEAYATSWASVLPAVGEAFGLVLVESLAAGTPVVADRSGAGPEIVDGAPVGTLFDPDDEDGLVEAMASALELGADPHTADRCRARAAEFDWTRSLDRWQEVYRRTAAI
jgi:phosphatidyl-myo-inositol alpha-mannosyltransferase